MIILLVLTQVAPDQNHVFFAVRFLIRVSIIFICGGTITCLELLNRFKSSKSLYNKSELERLFENTSFTDMFREYAEKEISLENFLIYQQLKRISSEGMDKELSFEDLAHVEREFMKMGSLYELNLPSSTRKQFYELFERHKDVELVDEQRCNDQTSQGAIRVRDLFEILIVPVMLNLSDTFSRLIQTSVYEEWEQVYSIQQKNAAVD